MRLTNLERVLQAVGDHRTTGANLLGAKLALGALMLALELRWRKEDRGVWPPTRAAMLPGIEGRLCAQVVPLVLSRRTIGREISESQG